ncbi:3'-5' exonuclease [Spiribacter pallidus]|uniref:Exonuclease domain-containing protein n=1 Tax=Spiribacter pallidus TaxID=1987936 RepID=A0ABV3TBP5_9GAMM
MRALRLPRLRKRLWLVAGAAGLAQVTAIVTLPLWATTTPSFSPALLALAAVNLLVTVALAWAIDQRLAKPLVATEKGAGILAGSNPGHRLEIRPGHWLGKLPETLEKLAAALARSRNEMDEAASAWAARVEARKARLETILREIREGVIVCAPDGCIRLYNRSARELLANEPALGLGRNINEVLSEGPVRHTLRLLGDEATGEDQQGDADLVCTSASGDRLLRCRLAKLDLADPDTDGFVMTLQDISRETQEGLKREKRLREAVERLRNPLTALGSASESLQLAQRAELHDDAQRFGQIMAHESQRLTKDFLALTRETTAMVTETWRMEDTHLGSLIDSLRQSARETLPRIQCRANVWVSAEPYLLSLVIEALLRQLRSELNVSALALSGRAEGSLIYMDLNWSGDVVAPDQLDRWLDTGLAEVGGTVTLREVLQRHDTTAWSQPDLSRTGRALLRLPLPGAPEKTESPASVIPARPEYYEFALEEESRPLGDTRDAPLQQLDYVVFDCETTGLEPSQGDEIVSIGAVRIHRGRVMHGETFELHANPARPIPALASSIHGITDEDVADAPPVEEVVRRFHAFAGDAILVGFNIAFDMRFLQLKQRRCGVRFDQPTLDALLLSILLHDHTGEHTMEGIAERLGVGIGGRHTALGDSLTTAEIFIRLLDLLPDESIHTLGDAVAAQERMVEFRRQQRAF